MIAPKVAAPGLPRPGSVEAASSPSVGAQSGSRKLGQLLRSDNMETAMWADSVIKQHILPEPARHLPFPYMKHPYD